MNLQVDVGNTFLKWRLLDEAKVVCRGKEGTSSNAYFTKLPSWREVTSIAISSVASSCVSENIINTCRDLRPDVVPFVAETNATFADIQCAYSRPSQMGVDRWLAVIAGYYKYRNSCCVVDCGSAITVDVISDNGMHLGGYIMPGQYLMKKSLTDETGNVRFNDAETFDVGFGKNTAECVQGGINFMITSVIDSLVRRMAVIGIKNIVITGGDGQFAADAHKEIEFCPDLVFEGLSYVSGVNPLPIAKKG